MKSQGKLYIICAAILQIFKSILFVSFRVEEITSLFFDKSS